MRQAVRGASRPSVDHRLLPVDPKPSNPVDLSQSIPRVFRASEPDFFPTAVVVDSADIGSRDDQRSQGPASGRRKLEMQTDTDDWSLLERAYASIGKLPHYPSIDRSAATLTEMHDDTASSISEVTAL